MKDIIKAIRDSPLVGRGTCSVVDECYSDSDLEGFLRDVKTSDGELTAESAVNWAIEEHDRFVERTVECRFGDDDDEALKIAKEWEEQKKLHNS